MWGDVFLVSFLACLMCCLPTGKGVPILDQVVEATEVSYRGEFNVIVLNNTLV